MNALGRQHMIPDQRHQRAQRCRAGTHPVRQRGDIEIDPLACIRLALAVERLVIAELGVQDHRQQVRPCATPGDRMERRGRLRDRLAGTAGKLLTHRLDHLPLARHALQGLGDRLAQLGQSPTTARACGRAGDDDTLAGQVRRQRATHRLATHEAPDDATLLSASASAAVAASAASASSSSSCSSAWSSSLRPRSEEAP